MSNGATTGCLPYEAASCLTAAIHLSLFPTLPQTVETVTET